MPSFSRVKTATLALTLMAAASAGNAVANTDTAVLGVTVQVQDVCTVDGGTLDFGAYSGGQTAALEATGSIRFLGCGAGDLSFALDGGSSGDETARTLSNASGDSLIYELYRNPARTQSWGSGANAMTLRLLVSGSGTVDVYGRIPGNQNVSPGSYSDAVNVTLTF